MNYKYYTYTITGQHVKFGYQKGFDINLNRIQLLALLNIFYKSSSINEFNNILPLILDKKSVINIAKILNIEAILLKDNYEYFIERWGVNQLYLDKISTKNESNELLTVIEGRSKDNSITKYAWFIDQERISSANLSLLGSSLSIKLETNQIIKLAELSGPNIRYIFNAENYEYYYSAVPISDYLIKVEDTVIP